MLNEQLAIQEQINNKGRKNKKQMRKEKNL